MFRKQGGEWEPGPHKSPGGGDGGGGGVSFASADLGQAAGASDHNDDVQSEWSEAGQPIRALEFLPVRESRSLVARRAADVERQRERNQCVPSRVPPLSLLPLRAF